MFETRFQADFKRHQASHSGLPQIQNGLAPRRLKGLPNSSIRPTETVFDKCKIVSMDPATTLAFNSRVDIPFEYSFSFMGASLRPELARIIAEIYLESSAWRATKERVLSTNALQVRAASSARRLEGELRKRLATLTHQQIVLLAQATSEE